MFSLLPFVWVRLLLLTNVLSLSWSCSFPLWLSPICFIIASKIVIGIKIFPRCNKLRVLVCPGVISCRRRHFNGHLRSRIVNSAAHHRPIGSFSGKSTLYSQPEICLFAAHQSRWTNFDFRCSYHSFIKVLSELDMLLKTDVKSGLADVENGPIVEAHVITHAVERQDSEWNT